MLKGRYYGVRGLLQGCYMYVKGVSLGFDRGVIGELQGSFLILSKFIISSYFPGFSFTFLVLSSYFLRSFLVLFQYILVIFLVPF